MTVAQCLSCGLIAVATLCGGLHAQADTPQWSGLSDWHAALDHVGNRATENITDPLPADASLVLFNPKCNNESASRLAEIVHQGRRLLMVAEIDESLPCLRIFGLQFADQVRLPSPLVPDTHLYRLNGGSLGNSGSTDKSPPVLVNRPRFLRHMDGFQPRWSIDEGIGVGYQLSVGAGMIIALSDSSILIDLMMQNPGNEAFASSLANWIGRSPHSIRLTPASTLHLSDGRDMADSGQSVHPIEWSIMVGLSLLLGIIIVGCAMRLLWQTKTHDHASSRVYPRPLSQALFKRTSAGQNPHGHTTQNREKDL